MRKYYCGQCGKKCETQDWRKMYCSTPCNERAQNEKRKLKRKNAHESSTKMGDSNGSGVSKSTGEYVEVETQVLAEAEEERVKPTSTPASVSRNKSN